MIGNFLIESKFVIKNIDMEQKSKVRTNSTTQSLPVLELRNVSKFYYLGDNIVRALDKINLTINRGEFISIVGPSGSGKSTFLQVASMLAETTQGKVILKGKDTSQYDEVQRAKLRNKEIGFIFQQFNLLPKISALENVSLPLIYAGVGEKEQVNRARAMLELVGLGHRLSNTPGQLSGGQQQRVAIARALVNQPSIIFADEPTGNLDSKSGQGIMSLLKELHQQGKTIVLVTHDPLIAKQAERTVKFRDGKIIDKI